MDTSYPWKHQDKVGHSSNLLLYCTFCVLLTGCEKYPSAKSNIQDGTRAPNVSYSCEKPWLFYNDLNMHLPQIVILQLCSIPLMLFWDTDSVKAHKRGTTLAQKGKCNHFENCKSERWIKLVSVKALTYESS